MRPESTPNVREMSFGVTGTNSNTGATGYFSSVFVFVFGL